MNFWQMRYLSLVTLTKAKDIALDLTVLIYIADPGCLIRTITTICVPLVFGLIVFVGIFGNALVIIVVATNAQAGTIHKKRNGMKGWVQTPLW